MSISSCCVTWGISVHALTKCGPESLFTLGMSFTSTSPNSLCSYSFLIIFFAGWVCGTELLANLFFTKTLTSSLVTLPDLSEPCISDKFAPSSLINFLTFGLAGFMLTSTFVLAGVCCEAGFTGSFAKFIISLWLFSFFFSLLFFRISFLRCRSALN